MWCLGVLPSVKLHALHGSVVPAGVTVLLGLCNPHALAGIVVTPRVAKPHDYANHMFMRL
jgi:hypothetical protein